MGPENPEEPKSKSQKIDDLKRINFWGTILLFVGILESLVPGLSNQGWGLPLLVGGSCVYISKPHMDLDLPLPRWQWLVFRS